jgi:hypothetical protein
MQLRMNAKTKTVFCPVSLEPAGKLLQYISELQNKYRYQVQLEIPE